MLLWLYVHRKVREITTNVVANLITIRLKSTESLLALCLLLLLKLLLFLLLLLLLLLKSSRIPKYSSCCSTKRFAYCISSHWLARSSSCWRFHPLLSHPRWWRFRWEISSLILVFSLQKSLRVSHRHLIETILRCEVVVSIHSCASLLTLSYSPALNVIHELIDFLRYITVNRRDVPLPLRLLLWRWPSRNTFKPILVYCRELTAVHTEPSQFRHWYLLVLPLHIIENVQWNELIIAHKWLHPVHLHLTRVLLSSFPRVLLLLWISLLPCWNLQLYRHGIITLVSNEYPFIFHMILLPCALIISIVILSSIRFWYIKLVSRTQRLATFLWLWSLYFLSFLLHLTSSKRYFRYSWSPRVVLVLQVISLCQSIDRKMLQIVILNRFSVFPWVRVLLQSLSEQDSLGWSGGFSREPRWVDLRTSFLPSTWFHTDSLTR